MGIRLRCLFSSFAAGLFSPCNWQLNFPKDLWSFQFSALIFDITGPASSCCLMSSAIVHRPWQLLRSPARSSTGLGCASADFFALLLVFLFFRAAVSSVFFFADFFGRVEESIADRSILSSTTGASTSGASILTWSGSAVFQLSVVSGYRWRYSGCGVGATVHVLCVQPVLVAV